MPRIASHPTVEYMILQSKNRSASLPAVEYTRTIARNVFASLPATEWMKPMPCYDAVIGVFDEIGFGHSTSVDAVIGVFDEIVSANPAKRYVWDGGAWVRKPEYVWNGTAWQQIV